MQYEDFERKILEMVYEQGVLRLRPAHLSYLLGLPHEEIHAHFKVAVANSLVEFDLAPDGGVEYYIPGAEQLARPHTRQRLLPAHTGGAMLSSNLPEEPPTPAPAPPEEKDAKGFLSAHIQRVDAAPKPPVQAQAFATQTPYAQPVASQTDGSIHRTVTSMNTPSDRRAVIGLGASVHDHAPVAALAATGSTALVPTGGGALIHIEQNKESFCDPSQTIFMRQIRVHGVESEMVLRTQIQRLFESLGYKMLNQTEQRIRFERGSVTFVLALVPLFVLIIPLFIYLFLYCMGRSAIEQEPLELDVQLRALNEDRSSYDIDLTFIGLHGIVLSSADQNVLNQEVNTLQDELRWTLAAS